MTTLTTMIERFEKKFCRIIKESTTTEYILLEKSPLILEEFIQSEIDLAVEKREKEIVDNLKKFFENEHPVDCIDGVTPVETYGYEKTHNNALQLAINLITKK